MGLRGAAARGFACRAKRCAAEAIRAQLAGSVPAVRRALAACDDLLGYLAAGVLAHRLRAPELGEALAAASPRLPRLLGDRELSALAASMAAAALQARPHDALAKSLVAAVAAQTWRFAPESSPLEWLRQHGLDLAKRRMEHFLQKRYDYTLKGESGAQVSVSFSLDGLIALKAPRLPKIDVFAHDPNDYLAHMAHLLKNKGSYLTAYIARSNEDFGIAQARLAPDALADFGERLSARGFRPCRQEGRVLWQNRVCYLEGLLFIVHCLGFQDVRFIGTSLRDLAFRLSLTTPRAAKAARLRDLEAAFVWHQRLLTYAHFLELQPCDRRSSALPGAPPHFAAEFAHTKIYAEAFGPGCEAELGQMLLGLAASSSPAHKVALFVPKEKIGRYLRALETMALAAPQERSSHTALRNVEGAAGMAVAGAEMAVLRQIYHAEAAVAEDSRLASLPESMRVHFRVPHSCPSAPRDRGAKPPLPTIKP